MTKQSRDPDVYSCWHPDCQDPSRDDQVRLNVKPGPTVFTTEDALIAHALEKHGIDLIAEGWTRGR